MLAGLIILHNIYDKTLLPHTKNSLVINGQVRPFGLMEASKERFPCGLVLRIRLAKELPLRAVMLDQYGMVLMQGDETHVFR